LQQQAQTEIIHAGIVGDRGDVLGAGFPQSHNKVLRNPAKAEATGHHSHSVKGQALQGSLCVRVDFVHFSLPFGVVTHVGGTFAASFPSVKGQ
jgi:hypothetical protein